MKLVWVESHFVKEELSYCDKTVDEVRTTEVAA